MAQLRLQFCDPADIDDRNLHDSRIASPIHPTVSTFCELAQTAMTVRSSAGLGQNKPKIKGFQFIEGRPPRPLSDISEETENMYGKKANEDNIDMAQAENKMCPPSTPATRLPLADLIGNPEDSSKRRMLNEITPEEHVTWQQSLSPGASQRLVTPARKRKRPRSSSPPSSQRENSHFFKTGEAQAAPQQLRTPRADPAADVWNHYTSVPGGPDAASGAKEVLLAHLIKDASPRSTSDAGSVNGLRRWASCGVEWPISASGPKRRKVRKTLEDQTHTEQADGGAVEFPKRSKVDDLLQRMKETLAKEREEVSRGPSSSSPLPIVGPTEATSPLLRLTTAVAEQQETPSRTEAVGRTREERRVQQDRLMSSSVYGDVDVDADMLEIAVQTEQRIQRSPQDQQVSKNTPNLQDDRTTMSKQKTMNESFISDDFGVEEGDIFTADFELLASKFDSQVEQNTDPSRSRTISPEANTTDRMHREPFSEDEFGGDDAFDTEEFAAAEAAATETFAATSQTPTSVCLKLSFLCIWAY